MRAYTRPYVGILRFTKEWVVFRSATVPTDETHGDKYAYCIGPFRTAAAANYMAANGQNNVNCQTTWDAERIVKRMREDVGPYVPLSDDPFLVRRSVP